MTVTKSIGACSLAVALFVPLASEARWNGPYIGVHAGHYLIEDDFSRTFLMPDRFTGKGALAGLNAGLLSRVDNGPFYFGYEVDTSFGSLAQTGNVKGFPGFDARATFGPVGSARVLVAAEYQHSLFFLTGGLSWAFARFKGEPDIDFDRFHIGWIVGAGIERALNDQWSVKFEYLYSDLDNAGTVHFGNGVNLDMTSSVFRVGLNYRLHKQQPMSDSTIDPRHPRSAFAGPYFGGHISYGVGDFQKVVSNLSGFNLDPAGITGGITGGYNFYPYENYVLGVESDIGWGSIRSTAGSFGARINISGSIRARGGYATNSTLYYLTGGFAWAHAKSILYIGAEADKYYGGYVAGLGIERQLPNNVSAKIEYTYHEFDKQSDLIFGVPAHQSLSFHSLRLGFNYFGTPLDLIRSVLR
ncbi:MAG: porin family protein [Xanthobacteraceae bacterium]|nr:porin family protein [Xanthobacteraceae bacterium]